MPENNDPPALAGVAAAILSGTPIDWPAIEAGASESDRELLDELRLLCTVADLHRDLPAADTDPGSRADEPLHYWGRLRLIERVGGGSFGDVYRAWDPRLRREVALKLLAVPDAGSGRSAAIIREGRLLARVRHPGVVTIYDAERIGSRVGLSMEFVDGPTLDQRVHEQGPLTTDETLAIGVQLCDALSAAHAAGVLHRDVKAGNVIVKNDGRVVLMDFGAGRELDEVDADGAAGTPLYLAPEVLDGQEATVRSDVYSLGVLLHYLLTASYPVPATSLTQLREIHARRRAGDHPEAARALAGQVAAIVARATAPLPTDRYESAAALGLALGSVGAPPARRGRTALMGTVSTIALLASAGWLLGMRAPDTTATSLPVRIAIMPFQLTSDRPGDDVLQDGMARGLISRLQTFENVSVISAASVLSQGAGRLSPTEAAAQLNVHRLLSGEITRRGEEVSARISLLAVPGEQVIWSRAYAEPLSQLSDLHHAITQDLATELRLTRAGGAQGWPTWNATAHALYIRGQAALDRMNREGRSVALRYFEQALELDPNFAQVHAAIADVYLDMFPPPPNLLKAEAIRRATAAAERAMSLDPNLPAAHVASASVKSLHGDWAGAERDYERAILLGPGDVGVRQQYAHWLSLRGRFADALIHAREAERIEPMSARSTLGVASVHRFAREWDASIAATLRALELDPSLQIAHLNLGHNYQGLGRLSEAIAAFERGRRGGNLGNALAQAGRVQEARAMIANFEKEYASERTGAADIAMVYVGLGEYDRALDWLERFEQDHAVWPSTFRVALVWDPLRPLPRFQAFLKRHHLAD